MKGLLLFLGLLAIVALAALPLLAQEGGGFDLSWSTIGGGGRSSGGGYELSGSVGKGEGQPLSGGGYTLSGGFWAAEYIPILPALIGMSKELDTDGVVVVSKLVVDTFGEVTGGLGSYADQLTYNGSLISILQVRPGDPPFDAFTGEPVIDNAGGMTTFAHTQTGQIPGPQAPARVAKVVVRLVGCKADQATLTNTFTELKTTAGGIIPVSGPSAEVFQRGDAKADGTVNIADVLFIAQFLAGLRDLGQDLSQVHPVNAASVKYDEGGDKITIADVLLIAQMLASLRNGCYQ